MKRFCALVAWLLMADLGVSSILPPNNLHLMPVPEGESMTEDEFNESIDEVLEVFNPIVRQHVQNFVVNRLWSNPLVNASAEQRLDAASGQKVWYLNMYGGLAMRPEVTRDALQMVVCHELGHHLAGYFHYQGQWASSEGQSDYFASQVCLRKVWKNQYQTNAKARQLVPKAAKDKCDDVWFSTVEQNLCYRVMLAGRSLATLLSEIGDKSSVSFATPSESAVDASSASHPKAQCRLDTYAAGALCTVTSSTAEITGLNDDGVGLNTVEDEQEAMYDSCMRRAGYSVGVRPRCWFKPQL